MTIRIKRSVTEFQIQKYLTKKITIWHFQRPTLHNEDGLIMALKVNKKHRKRNSIQIGGRGEEVGRRRRMPKASTGNEVTLVLWFSKGRGLLYETRFLYFLFYLFIY